jgi:hypothetical protein
MDMDKQIDPEQAEEQEFVEDLQNANSRELTTRGWDNGIEPVGHLTPKAKQALKYYALGWTVKDITENPEISTLSAKRIRDLINSVAGQNYLAELDKRLDDEFLRLKGKYVSTLRECLDSADPKIRLAAASLYQRRLGEKVSVSVSAEDEISGMMKNHSPTNPTGVAGEDNE